MPDDEDFWPSGKPSGAPRGGGANGIGGRSASAAERVPKPMSLAPARADWEGGTMPAPLEAEAFSPLPTTIAFRGA